MTDKKPQKKPSILGKLRTKVSNAMKDDEAPLPPEEDNKKTTELIKEVKQEIKQERTSKERVESALERFRTLEPEAYNELKLFWNGLIEHQEEFLDKIAQKFPQEILEQVSAFVRDKKTPRNYWEVQAQRTLDDPLLVEDALGFLGIGKNEFLYMARINPDQLLLTVDNAADKLETQYQNQNQDAQNKGDRQYIEELKKRYNVKGEDSQINKIDLIFRAAEDEGADGIPAFEHLIEIREWVESGWFAADNLSATNKYRKVLTNAILAKQSEYLQEARNKRAEEELAAEKKEQEKIEKTKEVKDETAVLSSLGKAKESVEKDIRELQRLRQRYSERGYC